MDACRMVVLSCVGGRPNKVIALIYPEDGLAEDGGFRVCACGVCRESAGPICAPGSPLGGLVRPPELDDVLMCARSGHTPPIMSTPFIK